MVVATSKLKGVVEADANTASSLVLALTAVGTAGMSENKARALVPKLGLVPVSHQRALGAGLEDSVVKSTLGVCTWMVATRFIDAVTLPVTLKLCASVAVVVGISRLNGEVELVANTGMALVAAVMAVGTAGMSDKSAMVLLPKLGLVPVSHQRALAAGLADKVVSRTLGVCTWVVATRSMDATTLPVTLKL